MSETKPYVVVAVEQTGRQAWSRHRTLDLARRAARKYRRHNPDSARWVDHYGYEIMTDGRTIETVR